MTRWTLRTGTRSDTVATVSRTDDVGEVLVDAIDPKGEFINFLDSQVGVVAPNKQRNVVELEQIGPGRYRGRFPAAQEGVYLVGHGPAASGPDGRLPARGAGGTVRARVQGPRRGRDLLARAVGDDGRRRAVGAEAGVPPEPAPVAPDLRPVAMAGGSGGGHARSPRSLFGESEPGMLTRMLGWFKGTRGSGKGGPGHDSPTAT